MTTSLFHETQPYEILPPPLLRFWFYRGDEITAALLRPSTDKSYAWKHEGKNLLIQPNERILMECKMNGRKSKGMGKSDSSPAVKSAPFQWVNCPLTDQDRATILECEDELPMLTARLLALVSDGTGVSVKYNSERKQYNCTIYRSISGERLLNLGLSSFAPSVRLACLVTLYKYECILFCELVPPDADDGSSVQFG